MKRAFLVLALCIPAIVCAGETPASPEASQPDGAAASAKDDVKVTVSGAVDFFADKGKKIYAEFVSSPKLTDALRNALTAAGYTLVSIRDEADLVYEADGAFQAMRPATQRTAEIRAGDYAEHPEPLKTKSGRGPTIMFGNPFAMVLGTIAENLATVTGARDAINSAAAGDPDGKCLSNCDGWKYRQRSVINIKRIAQGDEQKMAVVSETIADALAPSLLFQRSLQGLESAAGIKLTVVFEEAPAKTSSGREQPVEGKSS